MANQSGTRCVCNNRGMHSKLISRFSLVLAAFLASACTTTSTATPTADKVVPAATANVPVPGPTLTPISLPSTVAVAPTATLLAPEPILATTIAAPTVMPPTQTPVPTPNPTAIPGINLRLVDWRKFLTTDKAFKTDPTIEDLTSTGLPYISVVGVKDVVGFPTLGNEVAYGDISGDGRDEALISLFSGGTAGNLGLLVFTGGAQKPVLVAALPGYKIGGVFETGFLKVSQPLYAGFEANCCPSGFESTRYKMTDGKLVLVDTSNEGIPGARVQTVEKFYEFISARQLKAAYGFLSPTYQKDQAYAGWIAGYKYTVSVIARDVRERADGSVSSLLKAIDATNKGHVTQLFHVVWSLIWDGKSKQWRLDSAKVAGVNARLSGKLQYPGNAIPPLALFAKNVDTGDVFSAETKKNQSGWSITVPPGNYVAFAYLLESESPERVGGYSEFVTCGLKAGCPSHKLIVVRADAGKMSSGVDVSDWYAPKGSFPTRP